MNEHNEHNEQNRYMIFKIKETEKELFPGYGKKQMIFTGIGAFIGFLIVLLIIAVQSIFFPYKEIALEDLGYRSEYLETDNPEIVLIDNEIPKILGFGIVISMGVLVTLPVLKFNEYETFADTLMNIKKFKKDQQVFEYEKNDYF